MFQFDEQGGLDGLVLGIDHEAHDDPRFGALTAQRHNDGDARGALGQPRVRELAEFSMRDDRS